MRKIIIIPEFASFHLLKHSIMNWIEVIEPDFIIINSGIFPEGPENKGHIDGEFRKKWCFENTAAGFDYDETLGFVANLTIERHSGNKNIPHIECRIIDYKNNDANQCFLEAIITGLDGLVEEGDIIFPLEPDVFFLESDKEIIQEEISKLKPGSGLSCMWRDFLETQYYCEAINEKNPKIRRFAYCFDNFQNYRSAMDGFMTQNYPKLTYTDKFWSRHYPWFVTGKYKELRYELIWRKDPQYWKDFENGLRNIREMSEQLVDEYKSGDISRIHPRELLAGNGDIEIRPSRQDDVRCAQFIDIPHPEAIKNHENFVK
jgi:hypothetical protein